MATFNADSLSKEKFLKEFSHKAEILIQKVHKDENVRSHLRRVALNKLESFINEENFKPYIDSYVDKEIEALNVRLRILESSRNKRKADANQNNESKIAKQSETVGSEIPKGNEAAAAETSKVIKDFMTQSEDDNIFTQMHFDVQQKVEEAKEMDSVKRQENEINSVSI